MWFTIQGKSDTGIYLGSSFILKLPKTSFQGSEYDFTCLYFFFYED